MARNSTIMDTLLAAVLNDDRPKLDALLKADVGLANRPIETARLYQAKIYHWMYVGDTALHLAAAGYRVEIVQRLLKAGADPNAFGNHRRSGPLHYASDGFVSGPEFDAKRQVRTIEILLKAGAEVNAQDKNGASPLHRAVRTRCAAAVKCLLQAGADPKLRNKPGSTPFHLAVQDTGRGGSGAEEARDGQKRIIREFLALGVGKRFTDGKGKTVLDCARADWIRALLNDDALESNRVRVA